MGKGSAPKAPDPRQTAAAQTESNQATAITQSGLNMVDQNTPFGNLSYEQIGTWDDGTPRFQANTTLSGGQQRLYDTGQQTQQNLANLARDQSSRLPSILNRGVPNAPSMNTTGGDASGVQMSLGTDDFSADRQRVEDAMFQRLNPQLDRDRESMATDLANRGIAMGSTAYSNAMGDFSRSINDARTGVILSAGQEQNRLQQLALNSGNFANAAQNQRFNQTASNANFGNSAKQQDFVNQLTRRQVPLNEIIGLSSGTQLQAPQFTSTPQTQVAGTDVAGITQGAYNADMAAYNSQQQGFNSMMGGLFGAGASLLAAPGTSILGGLLSDERSKDDIRRVGKTDEGTPIYTYSYKGDPSGTTHMGVMAQEVRKKNPEAIVPMGSLLGVDYRKVA